ncbi:MAG: hypothetical protein CMLOHMNK_02817 [Steroidobacteraceae bacterium]|nr:hypothetical protein [Steroidobacteraceae bacterium]
MAGLRSLGHATRMDTLRRLVDALSRRWWAIALLAAVTVWMARRLFALSAQMRRVTGFDAFDMQQRLGISDIAGQLAHYTPEAVRLYGDFSSTDFLFPFVSSLLWAALLVWGLRRARPALYEAGAWSRLVPWLFLGCVFDWIENVANAWLVGRYPPLHTGVAALAVIAKYGKMVAGSATIVLAVAFALWGASASITRYLRRRMQ